LNSLLKIQESDLPRAWQTQTDREEAYYWKGWFDAFRRTRNEAAKISRFDPVYKEGWNDVATMLKRVEQPMYERLQAIYSLNDLLTFMNTGVLPGGEFDEQRIEEKTNEDLPQSVLLQVGESLLRLSVEEVERIEEGGE